MPTNPRARRRADHDKLDFYPQRHREGGEVSEFQDPEQNVFREPQY